METIINKAIEGGYDGVPSHYNTSKSRVTLFFYQFILDPLFWQALGRVCEWDDKETGFYFKEINEKDSIVILDEFVNISLKFHEINLTQGFDKAAEWLAEQVK